MSLSVGIVGLPNVGKSTLFNALLKRQAALVAEYPFTTIEPNVGVVPVPDLRLARLARTVTDERGGVVGGDPSFSNGELRMTDRLKIVPATVRFVDIAGLVAGAHKGEGLGNQFLAHIRECDLIVHVLRGFHDFDVVRAGSEDPAKDLETVRLELVLKDLETLERVQSAKGKAQSHSVKFKTVLDKIQRNLDKGEMVNHSALNEEEKALIRDLFLLTVKPEMVVLNVSENKLTKNNEGDSISASLPVGRHGWRIQNDKIGVNKEDVIVLSAKLESELGSLSDEDQKLYLKELGIGRSALERLVKRAYEKLNLISFFTTVGSKEVRAWAIEKGTPAFEAAAMIHSDFKEKFIKAKVAGWKDFVKYGGFIRAKGLGKIRCEGKGYQIKEGEVVEFVVGN